jgi:hypothetical protein
MTKVTEGRGREELAVVVARYAEAEDASPKIEILLYFMMICLKRNSIK